MNPELQERTSEAGNYPKVSVVICSSLAIVSVWSCFVVWWSSDAGENLLVWMFGIFCSGIGLGVVWIAMLVPSVIRFAKRRTSTVRKRELVLVLMHIPFFFLAVTARLTDLPFRARFALSEKELHQYVHRLPVGYRAGFGSPSEKVGLFTIREAENLTNCIRIITCSTGMANHAGLVYCPVGTPPVLGEDQYRQISGPWWHWHRSW